MLRLALRLLITEGELRDVVERLDVGGLHAGLVERALVVHRVVVCIGHHILQALQLQRLKFRPRHAFDLRIVVLLIVGDVFRHGCSLFVMLFRRRFRTPRWPAAVASCIALHSPALFVKLVLCPDAAAETPEHFSLRIFTVERLLIPGASARPPEHAAYCMKPRTRVEHNRSGHSMF